MHKIDIHLDKFGFPKKPTQNYKISILKEKKIFFFSKFFRKFDLCMKLPSYDLIKNYYGDSHLDNFYYNKIKSLNFNKIFLIKINLKLIAMFSFVFFKKENIRLRDGDILLFGPFSHSYHHAIYEYFLRLTYLKSLGFRNIIWLPYNLKLILKSNFYRKLFKNLNFNFYDTNNNNVFENCSYLTHVNTRWYIKNNKKLISNEFSYLLKNFRKNIFQTHPYIKNNKYKFIIVSRSNFSRKLINENELYKKLKKYNFNIVNLENYSYQEQINIARNCKIMIGYHGGGLTNTIFMKPKSSFIEIFNRYYKNPCYKNSSKIIKLRYKSFECEKSYKNLDGICNISQLEKYIQKII